MGTPNLPPKRCFRTFFLLFSQVNPYETDNVADVLDRALEMSIDERRLRMNQVTKQIEVSFSCLNTEQ